MVYKRIRIALMLCPFVGLLSFLCKESGFGWGMELLERIVSGILGAISTRAPVPVLLNKVEGSCWNQGASMVALVQ